MERLSLADAVRIPDPYGKLLSGIFIDPKNFSLRPGEINFVYRFEDADDLAQHDVEGRRQAPFEEPWF
jgi:hypothetical protein